MKILLLDQKELDSKSKKIDTHLEKSPVGEFANQQTKLVISCSEVIMGTTVVSKIMYTETFSYECGAGSIVNAHTHTQTPLSSNGSIQDMTVKKK